MNSPVLQPSEFPGSRGSRRPSFHKRRSISRSRGSIDLPVLAAARTICPKDTDAFCYDPSYLPAWLMPELLWNALCTRMYEPVKAMQQAGASVLTSFARLTELFTVLDGKVNDDETFDSFRPPPRTPSLISLLSLSDSGSASPGEMVALSPTTPVTPFDLRDGVEILDPASLKSFAGRHEVSGRGRSGNFALPPLNPRVSQWRAEMSSLRGEALVRLRHSIRKVEGEWNAAVHEYGSSAARDPQTAEAWAVLVVEFARWLREKKEQAGTLESRVRAMGTNVLMGWGGAA